MTTETWNRVHTNLKIYLLNPETEKAEAEILTALTTALGSEGDAKKMLALTAEELSTDRTEAENKNTATPSPTVAAPLTFFENIALPLVARGWKVAPCYPKDKKIHTRLVPDPLAMISKDPAQIHAWGSSEPNANVCVYAEQADGGMLFLDKDGAVNLREKYEHDTGKKFPQTLLVRSSVVRDVNGNITILKGHWYFYQTPRTLRSNNISEDSTGGLFSLRVRNEYVTSIGSIHPKTNEPYVIAEDSPVVPMPDEFLDWLLAQVIQKPKTRKQAVERGKFGKGSRYPALISETGKLWQRGYSEEDTIETAIKWARENFDIPEGAFDDALVRGEATRVVKTYEQGDPTRGSMLLTQGTQALSDGYVIPIVDDPADDDPRFEMTGEKFDTKVYEDLAQRSTPYPDPGEYDLVSLLSRKLVTGTNIPLAYVREPLKAMVLHALDGKLSHPAHRKMSLRGNYFSLGESEGGKTTGLEFAMEAADLVLKNAIIHPENLFRYKSETTFIRSFTTEGTIKRDAQGAIKSGRIGNPSQFLYIKEGNLVANCSDYFGSVFSQLTNLYDQTEAGTESMSNGDFSAPVVKASIFMCFTPSDFKATFGGKGTIGGGGLNRWAASNPPEDHSYDDKDWDRLDDSVFQKIGTELAARVFELCQGTRQVLQEEPEAQKIRLEVKSMLRTAGKVGKRLLDYFMREQVAQASVSIDESLWMTTRQAEYAKQWVLAQLQARLECWPSDSDNKIVDMEHAIRKAVSGHFVSEKKLKDACNYYRENSGGWFVFNAAMKNTRDSGAIKLTGKTRKNIRAYCPGSCTIHPAIKDETKK